MTNASYFAGGMIAGLLGSLTIAHLCRVFPDLTNFVYFAVLIALSLGLVASLFIEGDDLLQWLFLIVLVASLGVVLAWS